MTLSLHLETDLHLWLRNVRRLRLHPSHCLSGAPLRDLQLHLCLRHWPAGPTAPAGPRPRQPSPPVAAGCHGRSERRVSPAPDTRVFSLVSPGGELSEEKNFHVETLCGVSKNSQRTKTREKMSHSISKKRRNLTLNSLTIEKSTNWRLYRLLEVNMTHLFLVPCS